jgi:hypothetical protein
LTLGFGGGKAGGNRTGATFGTAYSGFPVELAGVGKLRAAEPTAK